MFGFTKKAKHNELIDIKRGDVFSIHGPKNIYYIIGGNSSRFNPRVGVLPISETNLSMLESEINVIRYCIPFQTVIDKSELKEKISEISRETMNQISDILIELGKKEMNKWLVEKR